MATVYQHGTMWWGAYRDYTGKRIANSTHLRAAGRESKLLAKQVISKWELEHALCRNGLIPARKLALASLDSRERARRHLAGGGAGGVEKLIRAFCEGEIRRGRWRNDALTMLLEFTSTHAIEHTSEFESPDIIPRAQGWLDDVRTRGMMTRRANDYRRTLVRFADWLLSPKCLIEVNQLARLPKIRHDAASDAGRARKHRALTPVEVERLCGLEEWGDYYAFLIWTGFRGETVEMLTLGDVRMADDEKGLIVQARMETVKNRVEWPLPLAPGLSRSLAPRIAMRLPGAPLFAGRRRELRRNHFLRDVKAAGIDPAECMLRSFRKTHTTFLRSAGVEDQTIGTLRLDRGSGGAMLRRHNYSEPGQLIALLRGELRKAERWYQVEIERTKQQEMWA